MSDVKTLSAVREKWARVTPQRSEDYVAGVNAPRRDWAKSTAASESSYEAGVQAAIGRKAFGKGVASAGSATWQQRASSIGVDRWGPGVQAGAAQYEKGFAPYREVIAKTALPPAYPRGDPRNYQRVQAIGEALRKQKLGK